jgi:hypothetical protein
MAGNFVRASSQYIDISTIGVINNGTIAFSFKSSTTGSQQNTFSADNTSSDYSIVQLGSNWESSVVDESIGWQVSKSSSIVFKMGTREGLDFYQDGNWHRCVMRVDGAANAIFVDGVKKIVSFFVGNASSATMFLHSVNTVYIGAISWSPSVGINGQVDDVRIYNVGLTDNECIAITAGDGNDRVTRGLQGHWRINEAASGTNITTALDISGNGIDGTGGNTPTYIESPLRIV